MVDISMGKIKAVYQEIGMGLELKTLSYKFCKKTRYSKGNYLRKLLWTLSMPCEVVFNVCMVVSILLL